MDSYHFSGWATRNDLLCADGRTIRQNAFKDDDGRTVPLIWNHDHKNQDAVLGHALLENRDEGVYAYCTFNVDTDQGKHAKSLVEHGDVRSLSIYANKLKQIGNDVIHGSIKELSLVLAGANQGAYIDFVMAHDEDGDDAVYANYDENALVIYHSDTKEEKKEDEPVAEEAKKSEEEKQSEDEKTVKEVWDGLMKKVTPEEEAVIYAMIGTAAEEGAADDENEEAEHSDIDNDEGGNELMHNNIFENQGNTQKKNTLSHADQMEILELAKQPGVGDLRTALKIYQESNADTLAHAGWENIGELFPDFKDVHPGAPELIERDMSWVGSVMKKAKKSPVSRIRTRQADARATELRAKGYDDRTIAKKLGGSLKLLKRTTEPQTVYIRDELHRDDIIDITDFDVVAYQKTVMKHNFEEVVALAALVGDGRDDADADKIHEDRIRPVWKDEEMYTIHYDIDEAGTLAELQGTNTNANFGKNYVRAEAMVNASLYSREGYKGKGQVDMYIDRHELNVMLLARDMNGRRIYNDIADLAKALNVGEIHAVEQFAGLTRTTKEGKTKKLLALFVNMGNYQFGATKGGELTSFEDFNINFNKYEYLMEGRLSGALTEIKSAIAIEEDVTEAAG
jgi:hypothetical protein